MSAYNTVSEYLTSKYPATVWCKGILTTNTITNTIGNIKYTTTNCTAGVGPEGTANTAITFNGTSSYVSTTATLPQNTFTIRVKFKLTANNNTRMIWSCGRSTAGTVETAGYGVMARVDGSIILYTWNNSVSGVISAQTTTQYDDDKWHEMILTRDASNAHVMYIDGVVIGRFTLAVPIKSTSTVMLGKLNVSTYESFFKGQITDVQIYNAVVTPTMIDVRPVVVLHDGVYKTYSTLSTSWVATTAQPPTVSDMINEGIMDTSVLDRVNGVSPLDMLTPDTGRVVVWSYYTPNLASTVVRTLPPQTIYQNEATNIVTVDSVNRFTVAGNNVLVGISVDNGTSWKGYVNGAWVTISSDITNGMTIDTVNGLTTDVMSQLFEQTETVKFAFCFTDSTSYLSTFSMTTNMKGSYVPVPTSDYTFTYDRATATFNYKVNKSGKYVMTYVS